MLAMVQPPPYLSGVGFSGCLYLLVLLMASNIPAVFAFIAPPS